MPAGSRLILWYVPQGTPGSEADHLQKDMINHHLWSDTEEISFHKNISIPSLGKTLKNFTTIWKHLNKEKKKLLNDPIFDSALTSIWFPHQYDLSSILIAQHAKSINIKTCFYEEGISCYYVRPSSQNLISKIKNVLSNLCRKVCGVPPNDQLIFPWIDEAWLTMNHLDSILPSGIPVMDLSKKFSKDIILSCLKDTALMTQVNLESLNYPQDPFILYLGSVEVEDHILDQNSYEDAAIKTLSNSEIIKKNLLIYKPHPRANPSVTSSFLSKLRKEGINIKILESTNSIPIEILYPKLNCLAVFGGISSPLFYLRSLYGAQTHSVLKHYNGPSKEISTNHPLKELFSHL